MKIPEAGGNYEISIIIFKFKSPVSQLAELLLLPRIGTTSIKSIQNSKIPRVSLSKCNTVKARRNGTASEQIPQKKNTIISFKPQ